MEGGIRVPAMARWPGVIPPGMTSTQPCITFDFTASIARIARVSPSADKPFEGIDIIDHVAKGKSDVERTLFWRKPRGQTLWKGVRQDSLKYVAHRQGERYREFLFDLQVDPGEANDLKNERPNDLHRLRSLYEQWETNVRKNRRGRPQ